MVDSLYIIKNETPNHNKPVWLFGRIVLPKSIITPVFLTMSVGGTTIILLFSILLIITILLLLYISPTNEEEIPYYRVAFIGNSITFVNDLPRFMEALATITVPTTTTSSQQQQYPQYQRKQHLIQESCLHGSLSFRSMVKKGNGMYNKWKTTNAVVVLGEEQDDEDDIDIDVTDMDDHIATLFTSSSSSLFDYGACTVKQLLFGYDKKLASNIRKNLGSGTSRYSKNPCYQDTNYYYYSKWNYQRNKKQQQQLLLQNQNNNDYNSNNTLHWDYVIMNDQTVYPGLIEKRDSSIQSLNTTFSKLFLQLGGNARPVFLATYGYVKTSQQQQNTQNTQDDLSTIDDDYTAYQNSIYETLGNVSVFTSRVWYGYHQYANTLKTLLPKTQQPIIAPVGPAFLLIHEENYSFWSTYLFYDDGYHPSPYGTFLMGCVLYATLYQRMPSSDTILLNSNHFINEMYSTDTTESTGDTTTTTTTTIITSVQHLWYKARKMQMSDMGSDKSYPTIEHAQYLMKIAERIVLLKEKPSTLLSFETIKYIEKHEAMNDDDDDNNEDDDAMIVDDEYTNPSTTYDDSIER